MAARAEMARLNRGRVPCCGLKGQNPWTSKDETVSFTVKNWMEGLQGTGNKKLKEANELLKKHGKKDRKDDEPLDLLSFYDR